MNIKTIRVVDEIEVQYNKRCISYFDTGYSYWYNGKEKTNNTYSYDRWEKVLKKYSKGSLCSIEYNEKYDYKQARLHDDLIRKSVKNDMENN